MADKDYEAFIELLTDRHGKIIGCETTALENLKVGNSEEYKKTNDGESASDSQSF